MSPASSTPSIRVYDSAAPHRSSFPLPHHHRPVPVPQSSPEGVMAIPGAREDNVPPPLPPPRYIGEQLSQGQSHDFGWKWGNTANTAFGGVKPGSSLLGGQGPSRRSASRSLDDMSSDSFDGHSDEDHANKLPALPNHRFSSEHHLSQKTVKHSSNTYDKQLLSKIGGPNSSNTPNTPIRTTAPPLSASAQETTNTPFSKLNGQLKPLSMPDRLHHSSLESPISRWSQSGAISPYSAFGSPSIMDNEPPYSRPYGSMSTPGPLDEGLISSHRGSYDQNMFADPEFETEESRMRDLNLQDRSPANSDEYHPHPGNKAGQKRRASSPPSEAAREDRPSGSGTDLFHRRSVQRLGSRNSPVLSRFPPNTGSLVSASSLSQRTGSFASSYGFSAASSMTSFSGERLSPCALPPLPAEADSGALSPYTASLSLHPSRSASLSRPQQRGILEHEHLQIPNMSTDGILHSRQNSLSGRLPGAYICECCPKKPKKYDTEDELRIHELEKQYTCQYCPNRFKNKNEAERHQNSLHLRRHSWSCAALIGVQAAFHPSPTRHALSDVCGYCGNEFPNPANWNARTEHLNHVHKFSECNQAKKFFRADHFRQHLKHSHGGSSGKWTNQLENACMKDEPPPKERMGSISSITGSSAMTSLAPQPGIIDEVHDES